jgi:hypothetical protein
MGCIRAIADKAGFDRRFHLEGRLGGVASGNVVRDVRDRWHDPDLRELLYRAGLALDAAGIHWTILSAFRDDYRQNLVSGFKAHTDNSLHGGSVATGGYGHGCAVDITDADGNSDTPWQWLDAHSARIGLQRLLPHADPAHVQPRGAWHELAVALRNYRLASGTAAGETVTVNAPTASTATLSDRESACVKLRHWEGDSLQAKISTSPMRGLVKVKPSAQTHVLAEKLDRTRAAVVLRESESAPRTVKSDLASEKIEGMVTKHELAP